MENFNQKFGESFQNDLHLDSERRLPRVTIFAFEAISKDFERYNWL